MTRLAAVVADKLSTLSETDQNLVVLDGDLCDSYGLENYGNLFPQQFIMGGIAEQNMISMAGGIAASGLSPWVFSFAAFLVYRGLDQIRMSMSVTLLPVVLVGSHAGGCGGTNGKSHQALSDIATIIALGGISVWAPCDKIDAEYTTDVVYRENIPTYIRTPRDEPNPLPGAPGVIRWITQKSENVIFTTGLATSWVFSAILECGNTSSWSILHIARLNPLPEEAIRVVSSCAHWAVVEDHVAYGGLLDLLRKYASQSPTFWRGWQSNGNLGSGTSDELREAASLDKKNLIQAILLSDKNY